jgi:hypothetical protein
MVMIVTLKYLYEATTFVGDARRRRKKLDLDGQWQTMAYIQSPTMAHPIEARIGGSLFSLVTFIDA